MSEITHSLVGYDRRTERVAEESGSFALAERERCELVTADDKETRFGNPLVDGTKVTATVVNHGRAPKIVVFKKKRRKHYKRTKGHRQGYTTLKIEAIG